jgi:flagellin-like protein
MPFQRQLFLQNPDVQRNKKLRALSRRRRRGISELIATVLTIAITLIAGAAVFSYVNAQAGVSEVQYGQAVGGTIDSIRERFVVVDMNYSQGLTCPGPGCSVTLWIYNSGLVNLQLATVNLYKSSDGSQNIIYTNNPNAVATCTQVASIPHSSGGFESPAIGALNIAPGVEKQLTLYLPCPGSQTFTAGSAYSVIVLSTRGNTALYYQAK